MPLYTRRKDLLSPLLAADHRLHVEYFDPARYVKEPKADAVILDGFAPRSIPSRPSLWIDPPKQNSPVPVKAAVNRPQSHSGNPAWIWVPGCIRRKTVFRLAEVFQPASGDVAFASVAAGPTIVLRPRSSSGAKLAVIGFDPLHPELRFTLTTPLVFANLLSWLSPESFRTLDFIAKRVGAASVPLSEGESRNGLQVTNAKGLAIPFTPGREHGTAVYERAGRDPNRVG